VSPRDWKERVQDILEALAEIQSFTQGMDFASFSADTRTQKAVELDLIVIGEAASHIPDDVEQEYPQIPWSLMRAMHNRLVHVYFAVDERLPWDTIQNDLPCYFPPFNHSCAKEQAGYWERTMCSMWFGKPTPEIHS
jgi:uncharacterized protein with HEPN domain